MPKTYTAQDIRMMLQTQDFAEWYGKQFEDYITGETDTTGEQIELDIKGMLS